MLHHMLRAAAGNVANAESHQYWRVRLTKTRDTSNFKALLAEVGFRETVGGSDQATGGTATGSSTFGGDFEYASAFDDDNGTMWCCASHAPLPQWIGYNFTSPVSVGQVRITSGDRSARAARAPEDFTIDYSDDGTSWTVYATFTGEPAWGVTETRLYSVP